MPMRMPNARSAATKAGGSLWVCRIGPLKLLLQPPTSAKKATAPILSNRRQSRRAKSKRRVCSHAGEIASTAESILTRHLGTACCEGYRIWGGGEGFFGGLERDYGEA